MDKKMTVKDAELRLEQMKNGKIPPKEVVAPLRKIIRMATAQDERIAVENQAKEKKAYEICLQKMNPNRTHPVRFGFLAFHKQIL